MDLIRDQRWRVNNAIPILVFSIYQRLAPFAEVVCGSKAGTFHDRALKARTELVADPDIKDLPRSGRDGRRFIGGCCAEGVRSRPADRAGVDPIPARADHRGSLRSTMPLNQVATISVPEPRMITVQVWDKGHAERHWRRRSCPIGSRAQPVQTDGPDHPRAHPDASDR